MILTEELDDILKDDYLKQFLQPNASPAGQMMTISQQLNKLSDAITVLDSEIQKQILSNYQDLLSQTVWVEKLEEILAIMQNHVQSLLSAVERLRGKIVEPFNRIENQTLMLTRLHETSDILRRVSRIQNLSRRLNSQMTTSNQGPDIVKAATSLHELELLMSDTDLSGLDIIVDDQQSIKVHRATVQKLANHSLIQGLHSKERAKVEMAVQVFQNLNILSGTIDSVLSATLAEIHAVAKDALDVSILQNSESGKKSAPGRAFVPATSTSGNLRNRFWESIERLFQESVYNQCQKIEILQRTLIEHHIKGFNDISEKFWNNVVNSLAELFVERSQGSSFVKQALEGEYPNLLRIFLDVSKRLKETAQITGTFKFERAVLYPFENAYLFRSIFRLTDPVHTMFSGEELPKQEEIDGLIRTITSELSVSLIDEGLSVAVSRNVEKAIKLFCVKCEQNLVTGGEASQVIDMPTAGQQTNVTLANLLHYLASQCNRVLANLSNSLSSEGVSIIATALEEINTLSKNTLAPLISSINDAIESIILTMHDDPEFKEQSSPLGKDITCSLYMRELQGFILRSVNAFLMPYKNQNVVTECCKAVAFRCMELFVRHACLIRPLTEYGRAKLIVDFGQMEVAVGPLVRGGQLGVAEQQQYRTLRAFKALLPLSPEEMVEKVLEGDGESNVPASLMLLHLYSGAPPELQSPHQSTGWSIGRLSQWMDSHPSEKERIALNNGPLQRYEMLIRQRNLPSFHPLFPLMTRLINLGKR